MSYGATNSEMNMWSTLATCTGIVGLLCAGVVSARADNDAAHAIVEKFAAEPDTRETPKQTQHTQTTTPNNNTAKNADLKKRLAAAEQRAAEARRKAEAARERAEVARRAQYEQEMLARARAEAAAAKQDSNLKEATLEPVDKFEPSPAPKGDAALDNARQRITVRPPSNVEEKFVETDLDALARQREAESDALSKKLRRARETHRAINGDAPKPTEQTAIPDTMTPSGFAAPPQTPKPGRSPTSVSAFPEQRDLSIDAASTQTITHATILLVMKPGKKGIRRWKKTADPMLCFNKHCYISRGKALAAQRITRKRGFGPGIALGKRAGACSNSLTCVFRDVQLAKDGPSMQPIDLRIVRHDRRKRRNVKPDRTCHLKRGKLFCAHRVGARDWFAWIVPESIAKHAGPSLLDAALATGLASPRTKKASR